MRLKSCRAGQGEGWGTGSRQAWSNWAGKAGRAVAAGGSGARDGSSAPAEPHSGATPGSPRSVAAAVAAAAAGPAAQPAAHLDFFNEGCQLVAVPEAAATLLQQRGVCLQCRQQGKAPPGSGAIGINRWNIAQRWASRVPVLHGCTSTGRVSSAHGKHIVVGKQAQVLFHTAARRLITRGGGGGVNTRRRAAAPLELRAAASWHSNARR